MSPYTNILGKSLILSSLVEYASINYKIAIDIVRIINYLL